MIKHPTSIIIKGSNTLKKCLIGVMESDSDNRQPLNNEKKLEMELEFRECLIYSKFVVEANKLSKACLVLVVL